MKIISSDISEVRFSSLKIGDAFTYEGNAFIKVERRNADTPITAIWLTKYPCALTHIGEDTLVRKTNITVEF